MANQMASRAAVSKSFETSTMPPSVLSPESDDADALTRHSSTKLQGRLVQAGPDDTTEEVRGHDAEPGLALGPPGGARPLDDAGAGHDGAEDARGEGGPVELAVAPQADVLDLARVLEHHQRPRQRGHEELVHGEAQLLHARVPVLVELAVLPVRGDVVGQVAKEPPGRVLVVRDPGQRPREEAPVQDVEDHGEHGAPVKKGRHGECRAYTRASTKLSVIPMCFPRRSARWSYDKQR